jgi:NADPH:quinone reductase-like Zn-dependent oxidoreductase
MSNNRLFVVARNDLRQSRFVDVPLPGLEDGEVLLKTDTFAFTANNITYAEMGERMAYWQFYPAPEGWGNIPVWGFADVVASRHPQVAQGERFYGYLPMATHAVLRPQRVDDAGFVDGTPHRQDLPAAYNLYLRTAADALYKPEHEALQALLRPVFITSFLIDDFLAEQAFFGAQRVLLSSASSKTAFGLAHLLHHRGGIDVVALTSAGHHAFVNGLGCYDRVVNYDDLQSLPADRPTVYVDFAGSAALRHAVHTHLDGQLMYSSAVGISHRDTKQAATALPGVKPVFFFAPDRLRQRARDWGRDGLDARIAAAWQAFVPVAASRLEVVRGAGPAAVESLYGAALEGRIPPREGHVLAMTEAG